MDDFFGLQNVPIESKWKVVINIAWLKWCLAAIIIHDLIDSVEQKWERIVNIHTDTRSDTLLPNGIRGKFLGQNRHYRQNHLKFTNIGNRMNCIHDNVMMFPFAHFGWQKPTTTKTQTEWQTIRLLMQAAAKCS